MASSLEQLFGSKVRLKLLKLFLENPEEKFYVREIARKIKAHLNAVRRELQNLESLGLVFYEQDHKKSKINKKYYQANQSFVLFSELRNLILKFQVLLQFNFADELQLSGKVSYLAFTGSFVGLKDFPTDLFIVGNLNPDYCRRLVNDFEKELGRPINYTFMTPEEYEQRKRMTDKFLYQILENKKIVLIDHFSSP